MLRSSRRLKVLCLALFLAQSLLLAQIAVAAPLHMETGRAERTVNWDEGFWQTRVRLSTTNEQERFCRYRVIETSRNPNNEPPSIGTSGYRLVYASQRSLEWQVWVKPYGHLGDQQRRWIDETFEVYFISTSATPAEISAAHCNPLSGVEQPYDPDPPASGPGVPTNPPPSQNWEAVIYLRRSCTSGGYVDTIGVSNNSCQAAKSNAKQNADLYDVCRFPMGPLGPEYPNDAFNGVETWIFTPKCRN